MLLNIIALIVIAICLFLIIFIIVRKFPELKTLNIETVRRAQDTKVRDRILLERLKRQTSQSKKIVMRGARPFWGWIKKMLTKIFELEKKYQKESIKKAELKGTELANKINSLLAEADKLFKARSFVEAEKIYIEVISLMPSQIVAYEGLTKIYLELKEYKQTLQTQQFILKLLLKRKGNLPAVELADAYNNLGLIYQLTDKKDKALLNYEKALETEPNNPRYIDKIIEISIMLKKKNLAQKMLKRLTEVNPENQKIKEYEDKINELQTKI